MRDLLISIKAITIAKIIETELSRMGLGEFTLIPFIPQDEEADVIGYGARDEPEFKPLCLLIENLSGANPGINLLSLTDSMLLANLQIALGGHQVNADWKYRLFYYVKEFDLFEDIYHVTRTEE